MTSENKKIFIIILVLFFLNFIVYSSIFYSGDAKDISLYFLNVGQGDSSAISVDGARFLIDAGKGNAVIDNIENIFGGSLGRYIDVVFISHPEIDHAGGLFDLLERYNVGVVLYNGWDNELWRALRRKIENLGIPYLALNQGDEILFGNSKFDVLWPNKDMISNEPNENSLVLKFCNGPECVLYTGDITNNVEKILVELGADLSADIMKVPHHGSKYSSSDIFVKSVDPKIAVIEVGKNSYGHPTAEAIERLLNIGAQIFRTDRDGIIKIINKDGIYNVFKVE